MIIISDDEVVREIYASTYNLINRRYFKFPYTAITAIVMNKIDSIVRTVVVGTTVRDA